MYSTIENVFAEASDMETYANSIGAHHSVAEIAAELRLTSERLTKLYWNLKEEYDALMLEWKEDMIRYDGVAQDRRRLWQ